MSNLITLENTRGEVIATWKRTDETVFEVTGVLVNGKRFKPIVTSSFEHAKGINLFNGTVWVRETANGPRKVLWTVSN